MRRWNQPSSISLIVPPLLVDLVDDLEDLASRTRVVRLSTKYEPPSGSTTSATPDLVGDDLLRAQRDAHRVLGRNRERLVHAVGVQALGAAEHGRRAPAGAVRTTLIWYCGLVSDAAAVWQWKRSRIDSGFVAPKRSLMIFA